VGSFVKVASDAEGKEELQEFGVLVRAPQQGSPGLPHAKATQILTWWVRWTCRETADEYPARREDYELLEEVGRGATARVSGCWVDVPSS
jgi:hypothetical protein